jgi:hypothetical protein
MRKSIYILAAAATMLVSCGETEKINNDLKDTTEPKAIGFSSYSEKATRGDASNSANLEFYHNTFAVYGTKQSKNDATDIQYLFGGAATAAGTQNGVTCTYQDPTKTDVLGDWRYDDPRFWDKQATFDFIAYAPVSAKNPIRYYYDEKAEVGDAGNDFRTTAPYILEGTNLQAAPTTSEMVKGFTVEANGDLDLMVSSYNGNINGAAHDEYVNLIFRHILAKFNVKVEKGEGLNNATVIVKEVTISGLKDKGTYTTSASWTPSVDNAAYKLTYENETGTTLNSGEYDGNPAVFTPGAPYYFIESLIMPQTITAANQVTVTVKYSIQSTINGGVVQNFTNTFDLYDLANMRNLNEGYNYTLTCTVQTEMIKFDASATAWDDVNANKEIIAQ